MTAVQAEASCHAGDHCAEERTSRQISPVFHETLGCQMGVLNLMVGGFEGYCGGTTIVSSKVPPVGEVRADQSEGSVTRQYNNREESGTAPALPRATHPRSSPRQAP